MKKYVNKNLSTMLSFWDTAVCLHFGKKNSNSHQSWGTLWKEKICKQNLSTILISRDTAVCLQFGAKIQNNLGDLKRVSGENFFYILSLKVVFSGLKSIKGKKTSTTISQNFIKIGLKTKEFI